MISAFRNHQEPSGTHWKPLPPRKPSGSKKWRPKESSRAQTQERRRSQHIRHAPRHPPGTSTEPNTTRETVRNQKSEIGGPKKAQGSEYKKRGGSQTVRNPARHLRTVCCISTWSLLGVPPTFKSLSVSLSKNIQERVRYRATSAPLRFGRRYRAAGRAPQTITAALIIHDTAQPTSTSPHPCHKFQLTNTVIV